MRLFAALTDAERAILEGYLEPVLFEEGTLIVEQGSPGNGCWFIDRGVVRLELDIGEIDSDGVLGHLDAGAVLGEFSLVDRAPRSADAWAQTEVAARYLSEASYERLLNEHPRVAVALISHIAADVSRKVRAMNERVSLHLPSEALAAGVDAMVEAGRAAQEAFAQWSDERVDALLLDVANAIHDAAPQLAEQSVRETGLGVVEHRLAKIRVGTLETLRSIADRPGTGVILDDPSRGLIEVASPMGVIFGLVPLTNPVSTFAFKTLICLRSRNSVILSCHRAALGVSTTVGEIVQRVLREHGAPEALVQWIRERSSRRKTAMFMGHRGIALILATGGPGMVRAAYSSGTPAIGVGAGNAPVLVASDADLDATARMILDSKAFDNGVVCGSEHNLVVEASVVDDFSAALVRHGAIVLTAAEKEQFMERAFAGGALHRQAIGKSAQVLLAACGIDRVPDAQVIVVPSDARTEQAGPLGREKSAPVLSLFTVPDFAAGMDLSLALLERMGAGHTAVVHTADEAKARAFGLAMPVSRVLVNEGSSLGCIGATNVLTTTLTLGCGTWGGGSTTDNVTMDHLRNIRRVAFPSPPTPG